MVVEAHTKQIEDFAFEPVRRGPNAGDAINTLFCSGFESDALVRIDREQVVDHLKRRWSARPVYARQIREVVEARLAIGSKKITDLDDACGVDVNGKLPDKLHRIADRVAKLRFQFFDEWMIDGVSRLWAFVFFLNWR